MAGEPNIKRRGKFTQVPELDSEFDNLIKQINSKITELNALIAAGGSGQPAIPQIQSDWDQVDNTQVDFIKNKPSIPAAQIQSDWNQANNLLLDYIKNKPAILTTEDVQDAVGNILDDSGDIDFTYDDATPNITAVVKAATITEAKMILADNTTNDVSISKHGFVPKAPNDTTKFLRGDGTWATAVAAAIYIYQLSNMLEGLQSVGSITGTFILSLPLP